VRPRHVEIQVLADHHGHAVHLFERECSIQRRHQKLVEESPSPLMTPELRERMGALALSLVARVGYVNAGTLEFLVDAERKPYFLEMNTRLQVEHPVTEMTTGVDLVKLQIRIAQGEALPLGQADLAQHGHAIEAGVRTPNRIPARPGSACAAGGRVRDDSGVYEGAEVQIHYDPLVSKLVVWAESRADAISRMRRAIAEYRVVGIRTTLPFFDRVLRDPAFAAGDFDTSFVATLLARADERVERPVEAAVIAAAIQAFEERRRSRTRGGSPATSAWRAAGRREAHTARIGSRG
jgi:acetyl-CoA carboxylase biotin carboxylase subunit